MNKKSIRALIVDDEIQACENLESFIKEINPNFEIIGFAHSTKEAEEIINAQKPNVVFLDIQMPNETGIEFLKRIENVSFETVFVTAYDEYAIKAFKLNAIDYVLKPINKQYLEKTLARISNFIEVKNGSSTTSTELIKKENPDKKNYLTLRNGTEIHYLQLEEIVYLSSQGNYTSFYTSKDKNPFLGSYNLKYYEEILPENFSLVHRGYIINLDELKYVEQKNSQYSIILSNEDQIPISRRKYKTFKDRMN